MFASMARMTFCEHAAALAGWLAPLAAADLQVTMAWDVRLDRWGSSTPLVTQGLAFHVLLDGACAFTVGQREHALAAGDAILMPPGTVYTSRLLRSMHVLAGTIAVRRAVAPPAAVVVTADHGDGRLRGLAQGLVESFHRGADGAALAASHAHALCAALVAAAALGGDGRLRRARALIDGDPLRWADLDAVARAVGMHRAYFARHFHRAVGVTAKRYQLEAKMRLARYLLGVAGLPVQEVAARLGYADAFAFSRRFKTVVGVPPSCWRSGERS
jgi:AraC-like DNA-binding protein